MEQIINLTPDPYDVGVRLDKYISEELEDISRSYIKKLIDKGNISVTSHGNERRIKASYLLSEGDEVRLVLPEPEKLEIIPENIPLDIVYEDEDVIVVNKPQDMVVHPAPGNYSGTLVILCLRLMA